MIDLHCHLLPGIDDGPDTLEEALALAAHAVRSGITHAVLTPHIHVGRYDNDLSSVRLDVARFQGEAMRAQLGPSFIGYLHDTLHRECPACIRLDGVVTDAANAKIMPPSDCAPGCSANYGIGPKIDWLADID